MRATSLAALTAALSCGLVTPAHASGAPPPSNGLAGPADAVFRQGMWWNPERAGNGWDINRVGDRVFVVWYTYDEAGNPTWYTSTGELDGERFQGELLSHSWVNNAAGPYTVAGSLDITFPSAQVANVNWQLGEHSGERVLQPFIFATEPVMSDYSGIWYDTAEAGYGLTVQTQGDTTFTVLYHYDAEGRPTWTTGTDPASGDSAADNIVLSNSTGQCAWCENRPHESTTVGTAALQFETESNMRVSLQFDGGDWNRQDVGHIMLSDPPSGRPHPAAMAPLASSEALRFYFSSSYRETQGYSLPIICAGPIVSPGPPPEAGFDGGPLSETNVQEQGVDEADVVKATWERLYSIDQPGRAALETVTDGEEEHDLFIQTISRYRTSPELGDPVLDGQYKVTYPPRRYPIHSLRGEGLYHHVDADDQSRLVYVGSQVEGHCYGYAHGKARIVAWDTGDDADADAAHALDIDGEIITTRVIGDTLYAMIRYRPDFHDIARRVLPPEDIKDDYTEEEFETVIEALTGDDLLPRAKYADGSTRPLLAAADILVPPVPATRLDSQLTVFSAFDLRDLDAPPVSMAIMGHMGGLYASTSAAWLAGTRWVYGVGTDGHLFRTGEQDTELHRFAITDKGFSYSGSGSIEGHLGSDPGKLSFRLSEHNGVLRVLSQSGWGDSGRWGEFGEHRLSIVDTQAGDDLLLATRAVLPNEQRPARIGKPGEQVYSVRYFGDRGYAVTYRMIDPLYALDLSDPDDPYILGDLEIPGYSDYLHPVSAELLLGVGMNASVHVDSYGNEQALIQGVQVGLFDVSDTGAPALLDQEEIGYRGSSTPVSEAHHAFTWLPADNDTDRAARFVLPVAIHGPEDGQLDDDPWHRYPWLGTGALMYEIAGGQGVPWLRRVGTATLADAGSTPEDHAYLYTNFSADSARSVIQGDRLLFYFRGGVFTSPWGGSEFTPAEGCVLCTPWSIEGN
ncbi:hypothetical protein F3N42_05405 [Marinihelvus fidelis]|uniref:Uncharacterized protein n=1 Tax=Marinihelvus fidelis TaxID=2613842 RepID=A0A5N0TFK2_9GAMM|nr:beta-propeller domain-containing protein [Marinihelvus fidelis]KAA9132656.1 hypothetical protein F3N42_05405 [Marinihelvus fidelis]